MRVLLINSVCGIGSTGRICTDLAQKYEAEGHEVKIAYGRSGYVPEQYKKYAVRIGTDWDVRFHALQSRLFDNHGFASVNATRTFLEWAETYKPDLLWLHNLHGYYINIELLFQWIKRHPKMEVKWTLHDCWAFTGHCAHFTAIRCYKWKTQCGSCAQKHTYPKSIFMDKSEYNYTLKSELFTGVKDLTIITPSVWLKNLVDKSFLNEYKVVVIPNEIDRIAFKPTKSDFRVRFGISEKLVVLGVASVWSKSKGLNDFVQLRNILDDNYVIVLVGLSKQQIKALPKGVIAIERTNSKHDLAEIYTAADVFINPSKEETFGLTTLEAMSCGTPAIVYKGTAGEEVVAGRNGIAIDMNIDALYKAILNILTRGTNESTIFN